MAAAKYVKWHSTPQIYMEKEKKKKKKKTDTVPVVVVYTEDILLYKTNSTTNDFPPFFLIFPLQISTVWSVKVALNTTSLPVNTLA